VSKLFEKQFKEKGIKIKFNVKNFMKRQYGPIQKDIKYIIRQTISISKVQYLAPFLKIYKGMKIIVMENLYPKLRIINGSINYIKNTSNIDAKWIQKNKIIHFSINVLVIFNEFINKHINLQNITLDKLPTNVISILPISKSFQYNHYIP
jgi:hypothetical protein